MPKLATAQGKVERINEQIGEAKTEFERLVSEIERVDGELTKELGKVALDEPKVNELETEREGIVRTQSRLSTRIEALQEILPDSEKVLNEAQLKDAITRHPSAIEDVNRAVAEWREKAKAVAELAEAGKDILEKKYKLNEVASEIHYLSAVLGKDRPKLGASDNIVNKDIEPLQRDFHMAFSTNCDPWVRNEFDEKLRLLTEQKKEAERAKARTENKKEAVAAG